MLVADRFMAVREMTGTAETAAPHGVEEVAVLENTTIDVIVNN